MVILRAYYPNYATLPVENTTVDLDVLEADQPILLDISAVENTEIGSVLGISSQTFSLPGTDNNNQFFGNIFNLGAESNFALNKSLDCQVLTDGQEVFKGKLYIENIITDQKGYTTYQVNVVNETVDIKFMLANLPMCEVNNIFDEPKTSYTYNAIVASWDDNLKDGGIVYPLVDYGIPEGNTVYPSFELGADSPTARKIDNKAYPLQIQQFKPAFRVRDVLNGIFKNIDYKYTSSFIDSDYFENIYVLPTANDNLGVVNADPSEGTFWAYNANEVTASAFTSLVLDFTNEVYDNGNDFDLANNRYTAYADGFYDFEVNLDYQIANFVQANANYFTVTLISSSGAPIATQTFANPPYAGTLNASYNQIYLTTGQRVKVEVEYGAFNPTPLQVVTYKNTTQNSQAFKGTGPLTILNRDLIPEKQFPCDLTALEFLEGLIQKFNWVVEPFPGERNLISIEPFQNWVDQGEVKDWTDKVDRSVRFKIEHPILEQPKTIIFRDEDDDAAHNKYTKNYFGEVFGTYNRTENQSDLPQGEKIIGKTFAATPVKGVSNTSMIIPTLGTRDDSGQIRPIKFKPRLLYKNGLKPVPIEATGYDPFTTDCYEYIINTPSVGIVSASYTDCDTSTTEYVSFSSPATSSVSICSSTVPVVTAGPTITNVTQIGPCSTGSAATYPGTYFIQSEAGFVYQWFDYLQMTTFEYLPTDASGSISGSRDLHFGNLENPGWYQYFQPVQNGRTTRDAYHEYWATYINNLYDDDARKLTCNIFLEPYEIQNIRLNDKLFIDGNYYRINNINGANITNPASVEVTLIKELNRQLKYPIRRIAISGSDTPLDLTVNDIDASGRVTYIDYSTGDAVSDYTYVSQAANKDGFVVFADVNNSASVSLEQLAVVTAPSTRTVYGANTVDPTVNSVLVAGDANNVSRQSNNLLVVGEANSFDAGVSNITTIGKSNSVSRSVTNTTIVGSNSNTVTTGSSEVAIIGGVSHEINASSLVTMVGGASNEIRNSITSRNVTIGGINNISDNNQTTTIINNNGSTFTSGSGHTVIGDVANRDLDTHRNQSTLMGSMYIEGAYFYDFYNFTGSDGGSLDLQSPTYTNAYAFFGIWSGSAGTYTISLPAISGSANDKQMEGRALRFKVDGSVLSSSYRVRLQPASSDTGVAIDGEANFDMRGPYDAISLVAHDNNWFVLQAKG